MCTIIVITHKNKGKKLFLFYEAKIFGKNKIIGPMYALEDFLHVKRLKKVMLQNHLTKSK
jgi:hypothetical protein